MPALASRLRPTGLTPKLRKIKLAKQNWSIGTLCLDPLVIVLSIKLWLTTGYETGE